MGKTKVSTFPGVPESGPGWFGIVETHCIDETVTTRTVQQLRADLAAEGIAPVRAAILVALKSGHVELVAIREDTWILRQRVPGTGTGTGSASPTEVGEVAA